MCFHFGDLHSQFGTLWLTSTQLGGALLVSLAPLPVAVSTVCQVLNLCLCAIGWGFFGFTVSPGPSFRTDESMRS